MLRYQTLMDLIQHSVTSGILKPGDRAPSIRTLSAQMGFSVATVQHAYALLESGGVLEARARSGFFVSNSVRRLSEFSASPARFGGVEDPKAAGGSLVGEAGARNVAWQQPGRMHGFGSPYPSSDLLPQAELHRCLLGNLRRAGPGSVPTPAEGALPLREAIARRLMARGLTVNAAQILITRSLRSALETCLDLTSREGRAIIVESPSDQQGIAAIHGRGARVIEIYSHPRFGIDPDQFRHLLENNPVACCVLTASNHKPTGISYSAEVVANIVDAATRRDVTIIENDAATELSYPASRGVTYRQFDTRDVVLQVGGFADTLGPGFGSGWIVLNDRFRAAGLHHRQDDELLTAEIATQLSIAEFMGRRNYDAHLRRLREALGARMRRGLLLMAQRLPSNCAVSHPTGGYMCWVRGPKEFDATSMIALAARQGVDFAPGPMFSITRWFSNFMALNFSRPWGRATEDELGSVARILRDAGGLRRAVGASGQ